MKEKSVLRKTLALSALTLFLLFQSAAAFAAAPAPPPPPPEPAPAYLPPAETTDQVYVSFQSLYNDKYVRVINSCGDFVEANRNTVAGFEDEIFIMNGSYEFRDGTTVNIRTLGSDCYFSAQPDGDLDADRSWAREWETFKLINLSHDGNLRDGDIVGFKSFHGKYVRVNRNNYDDVDARNTVLDQPWEKFKVVIHPFPSFWKQINADGFGSIDNRYAWSMAAFNDALYVGALNLSGPILGFFYDFLGISFPCTSDGGEMWRYIPDSGWERIPVNIDRANVGFRCMKVFKGMLYAGTSNEEAGLEMWRTRDGNHWEQVGGNGFGDPANVSTRALHVHGDFLYVCTKNGDTGGQIWRSQDGNTWSRVTGVPNNNNENLTAMATHNGRLFVGTQSIINGFEIWRSTDEDGLTFETMVTSNGIFQGDFNIGVNALEVHNGRLYCGTLSGPPGGLLLILEDEQDRWVQVGEPGFGNEHNIGIWTLYSAGEWLYMGTRKAEGIIWGGFIDGLITGEFDLYRSRDGIDWQTVSQDGFGDNENYGVRNLAVMDRYLYLGTAKLQSGCEVWRKRIY